MARAALELGVREAAKLAGLSAMTVTRFENGHSDGSPETRDKLMRALEEAGVEFTNGDAPGVRLRRRGPPDEGLRPGQLTAGNDG